MSSDKHGVRVRILIHGLLEALSQVLFERGVLDDRDRQGIVKAQHSGLVSATRDAFDLLNLADLEAGVFAMQFLDQKRDQHGPLAVSVDGASGTPLKRCEEQGRAGRWVQL